MLQRSPCWLWPNSESVTMRRKAFQFPQNVWKASICFSTFQLQAYRYWVQISAWRQDKPNGVFRDAFSFSSKCQDVSDNATTFSALISSNIHSNRAESQHSVCWVVPFLSNDNLNSVQTRTSMCERMFLSGHQPRHQISRRYLKLAQDEIALSV
jgi:hypothetical protein